MSEAQQKSKSDLKDVLGVFLSKSQESSSTELISKNPEIPDTQVISFCSPFNDEETFALNLLFPSVLSRDFKYRYLATNPPSVEDLVLASRFYGSQKNPLSKKELADKYYWIHWSDRKMFEDASSISASEANHMPAGSLVVLDLLRSNLSGFEQTIRVLDQLILVVRPTIEDLKNAYKIIKSCYYINRQLETSIIFNSHMNQSEVEKVFSKFADIVSQFLVLPIRCWGAIPVDINSGAFREQIPIYLNLDVIAMGRPGKYKTKPASLERIRFLQKLKLITE